MLAVGLEVRSDVCECRKLGRCDLFIYVKRVLQQSSCCPLVEMSRAYREIKGHRRKRLWMSKKSQGEGLRSKVKQTSQNKKKVKETELKIKKSL